MQMEYGRLVYERGDCPLVNKRSDFAENSTCKRYIVKLWTGSGYTLSGFLAWASSPEWALIATVAWIIDHDEYKNCLATEEVGRLHQDLTDTDGKSEDEADDMIDEAYTFVSCLYDGADINEYVRTENLAIMEADPAHYDWYQ